MAASSSSSSSESTFTLVSRNILILDNDQPYQICYNGSLPFFFTKCEPSENEYCSLKGPDYGCTTDSSNACTDFHLCNTPDSFFIVFGVILGILALLLSTGCCWCCFCCFCGRCCRRTCPCFTGCKDKPRKARVTPESTAASSAASAAAAWNMYAGLENIKEFKMEATKPTAPPYNPKHENF